MTHAEYDEDMWKSDCACRQPPAALDGLQQIDAEQRTNPALLSLFERRERYPCDRIVAFLQRLRFDLCYETVGVAGIRGAQRHFVRNGMSISRSE